MSYFYDTGHWLPSSPRFQLKFGLFPGGHLLDAELGARDIHPGEAAPAADQVPRGRLFQGQVVDLGRAVAVLPTVPVLLVRADGRAERSLQPRVQELRRQSVDCQRRQVGHHQQRRCRRRSDDVSPRRHGEPVDLSRRQVQLFCPGELGNYGKLILNEIPIYPRLGQGLSPVKLAMDAGFWLRELTYGYLLWPSY